MAQLKQKATAGKQAPTNDAAVDKYGEAYDNAQTAAGGFPVGVYDAAITDYGLQTGTKDNPDSEKESLFFEFTIIDGDLSGSTGRSYYQLFDEDGEPAGGFGFFKRDLEKLGQERFRNRDEMVDILESIKENQPKVQITVKQQKNSQYTNTYIDKLLQE